MAKAAETLNPTRADFEALLAESFGTAASAVFTRRIANSST